MENYITAAWRTAAYLALPLTKTSAGRLDWRVDEDSRSKNGLTAEVRLMYTGSDTELKGKLTVRVYLSNGTCKSGLGWVATQVDFNESLHFLGKLDPETFRK